jgi:hypothetical protein
MNTNRHKVIQIKARITKNQHADLLEQAQYAGVTLSNLIRLRIFNKPVISSTDNNTAKSIDQIGRMLKHYYPKDKGWASTKDRQEWWRLVEELREIARKIHSGSKS